MGRPVQPYGGSVRTLKLARDWVDDCYNNHQECRSAGPDTIEDPQLPSRLIDIGDSDEVLPRLVLSRGGRGKWIAHSHRWADTPFLRTDTGNIEAMQAGFPLEALPKRSRMLLPLQGLSVFVYYGSILCVSCRILSKTGKRKQGACLPSTETLMRQSLLPLHETAIMGYSPAGLGTSFKTLQCIGDE